MRKRIGFGALLLHLVATETYYQLNTFEGIKWESWPDSIKQKWDIPMNLGDPARKAITGNTLDYYVNLLKATREKDTRRIPQARRSMANDHR
jgi:hypothetical protein